MGAVWQYVKDMLGDLVRPLKSLLIALSGVLLAILMIENQWTLVIKLTIGAIAVSFLFELVGRRLLPRHPRTAVALFELWMLGPATLASVGMGLIVLLAIQLSVPDDAAVVDKQILQTISSALTAFLTAGVVSVSGEAGEARLAQRISRIFQAKYTRGEDKMRGPDYEIRGRKLYFKPGANSEALVHSALIGSVSGWGYKARWLRANALAEMLAKPDAEEPQNKRAEP